MGATLPEQTPPLDDSFDKAPRPRARGARFVFAAAIGTALGSGFFPFAPASFTSLLMLVPGYFLARQPLLATALIVSLFFVGVPIAGYLEGFWGRDPHPVTLDEVVGTLVTFLFNPVSLWGLGAGFLIWRFFDVVKLPFVDRSQRLPGGWGVMTDDLLAGVCANLILRLALALVPLLRYA